MLLDVLMKFNILNLIPIPFYSLAFQRYGKDFDAVSEVLDTKTPDMVKAFYYEMQEQIDDVSFAFLLVQFYHFYCHFVTIYSPQKL